MTDQKLTKNQRREQAREQARLARDAEKKREKRSRLILQGSIVLVILAILAVVALVLSQSMKPAGPGPANMISGGVTFGADLKVVETPALEEGEERQAREVNWEEPPIDVTIFVDYMCPGCGAFEQQHGAMFQNYVGAGDVELTVYPVNFQDTQSLGTKYSTRAANLLSCLAEQQPDHAFDFHNRVLSAEVQPSQGTTGLTDDQLLEQAELSGATLDTELRQCVKDQRFASFISGNTKQVSERGILGLAEGVQLMIPNSGGQLQPADQPQRLGATPTVLVNGHEWNAARDGDLETYILKLKSQLQGEEPEEESTGEEQE